MSFFTLPSMFMYKGNTRMHVCLRDWIDVSVHVYVCIYVFTNPSTWAGFDSRAIFNWSLTGLNSEFSFSKAGFLSKAKEPSSPYYLPIVR